MVVLTANTSQGHPCRRCAPGGREPRRRRPPTTRSPPGDRNPDLLRPTGTPDPDPIEGPTPGVGPTAGRAKAVASGAEAARVRSPRQRPFPTRPVSGEYDIVATFGDKDELCGQQHVSVVEGRLRSLTFSCRR